MPRPIFEGVSKQGFPFARPAQTIGELPPAGQPAALAEATKAIAARLGMAQTAAVKHHTPVFCAFNDESGKKMTRQKALHHGMVDLLLTLGCDVSLDFCASYPAPVPDPAP